MAAVVEAEQGIEVFEAAGFVGSSMHSEGAVEMEPFYVERHSCRWLKKLLGDSRKYHGHMMAKAPYNFQFVKKNDPEGPHSHRMYYLAMSNESRENALFYSEIPKKINRDNLLLLSWKPLLERFQSGLWSEEELLRERKRIGPVGIVSYELHRDSGTFLFQSVLNLYTFKDGGPHGFTKHPLKPITVKTSCPHIRMDPKLCPVDPNWYSFIHRNDIWIANLETGEERRLTFVYSDLANIEDNPKCAGIATFVLQEEFDRYTGYWWCPTAETTVDGNKVLWIFYEENDESKVEVIHVTSPMLETRKTESFRYPRTGIANPKITLKMSELTVGAAGVIVSAVDKELVQPFEVLFLETEYIVRAGWTREGRYAWAILLNRFQTRLQIVLIPPALFIPVVDDAIEKQRLVEAVPDSVAPFIIYEETRDIWISVHDVLHIFPQMDKHEIKFIFASECKTGFRHLYKITTHLQESTYKRSSEGMPSPKSLVAEDDFKCPIKEELALTSGNWEVLGRHGSNISVNEATNVVYFQGTKDTPLEHHLYSVSCEDPAEPEHCTERGYSHSCFFSQLLDMFVSKYSNQENPRCMHLFRLPLPEGDSSLDQRGFWASMVESAGCPPDYIPPEVFSFESQSGHTLYGMLYRPHNLQQGKKYPTVVFVYGAPQVAIAGAPVNLWQFYDTGYTERYMGSPDVNERDYDLGSVAMQADRFPSEPNRLLLLHGFLDENVHCAHTSILC
ncbi:dipeptidyl peptidase 8-like [Polyodon spathula]|uniref:dipeptidyl peptidase 8-like n=1 Tax=Polyodon spathula TaxID=7913 RepID=UPI001B7EBA20|nr:dipeptidyl peptidase 8-like [Polyodon spathula]